MTNQIVLRNGFTAKESSTITGSLDTSVSINSAEYQQNGDTKEFATNNYATAIAIALG